MYFPIPSGKNSGGRSSGATLGGNCSGNSFFKGKKRRKRYPSQPGKRKRDEGVSESKTHSNEARRGEFSSTHLGFNRLSWNSTQRVTGFVAGVKTGQRAASKGSSHIVPGQVPPSDPNIHKPIVGTMGK